MFLVYYGGVLVERAEARGFETSWSRYGKSTWSADVPSVISSGPLVFDTDQHNWVGATRTVLDYRKGTRLVWDPAPDESDEEMLLLLCALAHLGLG